ncbi:MAG: RsmB/NOP family class I SAM-dependent RNA methyltransferase [Verrucomicrobiota bacterium]
MSHPWNELQLAAEVVRGADREHPADAVLAQVLKRAGRIPDDTRRNVARAVFQFYRWFQWLAPNETFHTRLGRAADLADRFRRNPSFLPARELRSRAVPDWALSAVGQAPDDWFRSLQEEPALWLRARPDRAAALAETLGDTRPGPLPESLCYEGPRDLFRTAPFQSGDFELQDISSQAVGLLCDPQPADNWWDACAGEGGKTLHLSRLMENRGLIWATDRAEWRLQVLKRRAARAGAFNYRSRVWDGGLKPPTKTQFDGVLVDAPCSGLGTWQRNPHARWTTRPDDVDELGQVQIRLLATAAASVKPGGKLVYAVCTLTEAETTRVADAFDAAFGGFEPWRRPNPLDPGAPESSRIWIWPQQARGNGMFIALWKRPAAL